MSSSQFLNWQLYYKYEPFGNTLLDTHFATLEAMTVNMNRKKGSSPYQTKDFMLGKPVTKKQAASEMFNRFKTWAQGTKDK